MRTTVVTALTGAALVTRLAGSAHATPPAKTEAVDGRAEHAPESRIRKRLRCFRSLPCRSTSATSTPNQTWGFVYTGTELALSGRIAWVRPTL